jgi:collagen type VII alpha
MAEVVLSPPDVLEITLGGVLLGPQGSVGATGSSGPQGATGPVGASGSGATGPQGIQGPQGATGVQGDIGPQGATGSGATGVQGPIGATGIQGATGTQGIQGAQGIQGVAGAVGATGLQGIQGIQGVQGDAGGVGATGVQGIQGISGPPGATGVGATGATGAAGNSASTWTYKISTAATSGYPGDGNILYNNATQTSATNLIVSHLTSLPNQQDIDILLELISVGANIIIQDTDVSANNQVWIVNGTPTNTNAGTPTSYWTIPVTFVSSAGTGTTGFANNHSVFFARTTVGSQGATGATGPTGATGITGATGPTGSQGATGSTGPQGLTAQGAWSSLTAYVVNDVVTDGGSTWRCILGNTNHEPPNITYWEQLAAKGDTGATGAVGATGVTGATGAAGTNGTNGAAGATGATGVAGTTGTTGATGATGTTGPQGATGPANGAWSTSTPTIAQGTQTNIAKTVNYSSYDQIGKTVHWQAVVTLSGAGQGNGEISLTVPVAEKATTTLIVGACEIKLAGAVDNHKYRVTSGGDTAANTTIKGMVKLIGGSGIVKFKRADDATATTHIGANPAGNLASGDTITLSATYEAA